MIVGNVLGDTALAAIGSCGAILNAPAEAKPLTAEEIAGGAPKVGATV